MTPTIDSKHILDWILIIDQKINIATEQLSSIQQLQSKSNGEDIKIFRDEDILGMFKISKRTLVKWRKNKMISFTQVEDTILYSEEDVQEFLKRYKNPSNGNMQKS